ncbi:uncharacterized protein LOC113799352 isoform X1 [Dermatophagoides pteronyssinus]|uniref:uncharacterized protein LOC113799352 isoform X1 n=1 Tax=Dermatophagoides pteronyssinus TaxID=6956 RepID=UPI003F672469
MFFFFCCCSKIPPVYLLYRFILIEQNCFLQFGILEFWNLKQTNKKNRIMSIIKEEIFDEQQTTLLSSSSSSTHLYNSNQVSNKNPEFSSNKYFTNNGGDFNHYQPSLSQDNVVIEEKWETTIYNGGSVVVGGGGDDGENPEINNENGLLPSIHSESNGIIMVDNNDSNVDHNNFMNQPPIDGCLYANMQNFSDSNFAPIPYNNYPPLYSIENHTNFVHSNSIDQQQQLMNESYYDPNQMIYFPDQTFYYRDEEGSAGFYPNEIDLDHHQQYQYHQQPYKIEENHDNSPTNMIIDNNNDHRLGNENEMVVNTTGESSVDSNEDSQQQIVASDTVATGSAAAINDYYDDEDDDDEKDENNKENRRRYCKNHEMNPKYVHQRFPIKLWNLASDQSFKPIRWSRDGMSVIINEHNLEPNLGYYFRSKKFSSFLRQLHLYGFRKVTRARNHHHRIDDHHHHHNHHHNEFLSEYQCNYFQRDNFELAKKIRRYYSNNHNNSSSQSRSSSEPISSQQSLDNHHHHHHLLLDNIGPRDVDQQHYHPSIDTCYYHHHI